MTTAALIDQAKAWLNQDPDAETRAELEALIASGDIAELESRFSTRLAFGTAGLRGELGAGPNRMNRVLVAQAAAGLARFLKEQAHDGETPSVAIGYDGRINSDVFARDSAEVMAGAGIRVLLFDSMGPTPLVPFAVKQLGLSAGVMVTASHNPPRDNGYKVYLGGANGGGQIISPTDSQIAEDIAFVAKNFTFAELPKSSGYETLGDELRAEYRRQTAALVSIPQKSSPKIVYTAMHGVGWATVAELFEAAGIARPIVVSEQIEPNGLFPTVSFPNPEEPGAMDLAFATAEAHDADLILANDPDADRLAVGIPTANGWKRLTGDQLGLVLGDWAASRAAEAGRSGTLACSIVSSSALERVAQRYRLNFAETLTGFKWITKVDDLIFGFEEALGYAVDPQHTPDKDGISAALVIASLAAELADSGTTLEMHLEELAERYGHFATGQISIRVTDLSRISDLMSRLRTSPPAELIGREASTTDLSHGFKGLPPTDGLRFDAGVAVRVIVRPSGTEPKLKCYLQVIGDSASDSEKMLAQLSEQMRNLLA
ncbi:MAG: phospho-sugar mutase [Microbacteriaceae bacterium]